jgi:hypothetical protein
MPTKRVAMMIRLTPEQYREFEKWRKKMGQDKTGFAALCIETGMQAIARAVYPQDFITPEQLTAAALGMQKQERRVKSNAKKKAS